MDSDVPTAQGDRRDRPKILVADDDPGVAEMFRMWFADYGCDVTVARDGLEAFRLATRNRYDLITLDLVMPVMGGLELLRALQLVGQKVKVLVISGSVTRQIEEGCRAAGALAVLEKPVDFTVLEEMVTGLLSRLEAG